MGFVRVVTPVARRRGEELGEFRRAGLLVSAAVWCNRLHGRR